MRSPLHKRLEDTTLGPPETPLQYSPKNIQSIPAYLGTRATMFAYLRGERDRKTNLMTAVTGCFFLNSHRLEQVFNEVGAQSNLFREDGVRSFLHTYIERVIGDIDPAQCQGSHAEVDRLSDEYMKEIGLMIRQQLGRNIRWKGYMRSKSEL